MGKGYAGMIAAWEAIAELLLNCWYCWRQSNKIDFEREQVLQPSAWVELQDKKFPFLCISGYSNAITCIALLQGQQVLLVLTTNCLPG